MKQKYLYLVDFNQPFPSSEYGGLIAVIANDDAECHSILLKEQLWQESYTALIMQSIVKSQKFELSQEYQSGLIEAFVT